MNQVVIIPAYSVWHNVCKSAIINMALMRGLEVVSGKCNVLLGVQVKSFVVVVVVVILSFAPRQRPGMAQNKAT